MKRLLLGAAIALAWALPVHAQAPTVLCGAAPSGSAAGCATQITPIVSQATESSHLYKPNAAGAAQPGNLFKLYFTNTTANTGYLLILNATAVPTNGAAVVPLYCGTILAGPVTVTVDYPAGPPAAYNAGIVAFANGVSGTCFTISTTSQPAGFFSAQVQ